MVTTDVRELGTGRKMWSLFGDPDVHLSTTMRYKDFLDWLENGRPRFQMAGWNHSGVRLFSFEKRRSASGTQNWKPIVERQNPRP
jgi:hypothetical protein